MERLNLSDKMKLSVGFTVVALALLHLAQPSPTTSPDSYQRDGVLWKYGVTPEAQAYIAQSPFSNKHLSEDRGGGMTYSDHWEVYSNQDEAIVHEASHVWSHHLMNPDFCKSLDEELKRAADKPVNGYYQELYYGNGQDFKGLKGNCSEEFASISSYSMGEKSKIPTNLQPFYKTLYKWNGN